MNTILEGLFFLFGVPVVIFVVVVCWVSVFFALMKLLDNFLCALERLWEWFEGRKADTKIDTVKPEPTKKEQKTLNKSYFDDSYTVDTTSGEEQYTCPLCGFKIHWAIFFNDDKCPVCDSGASLAILQWQHYTKEITSIKKWLKGRNIPTETKDELRRRLNKIGGV